MRNIRDKIFCVEIIYSILFWCDRHYACDRNLRYKNFLCVSETFDSLVFHTVYLMGN